MTLWRPGQGRRAWIGPAALACVLLQALPVGAEDVAPSPEDVKLASQEFDQGRAAFKRKEWVEAAEHFEAADSRAPAPAALELAIRSRDMAGQLDRAATLAALALARHPEVEKLTKLAQQILARAAKELHEVAISCDTPCEILVETALVHGRPATARRLWLQPGEHNLIAGWSEGRTQRHKVSATKGGNSEVSFQEPPKPVKPAEPVASPVVAPAPATPATASPPGRDDGAAPQSGGMPPIVFFSGLGVTVVLGGVTVWSGLDAQANPGPDAVREACDARDVARCESLFRKGKDAEARTNLLIGVTAGAGVITGVIGAFLTDWQGTPARASGPRVEPFIGLGSGPVLGARGTF